MKISGPGPTLPPDATAGIEEAKRPSVPGFADKLTDAAAVSEPATTTDAAAIPRSAAPGPVSDIAAELSAGKITPRAALDQVIERVLAQKVAPDAPAAVRAQVTAALRQALEDDPLLGEKLRALGNE